MQKESTIQFIITGGTVDSHFNLKTDQAEIGKKTGVPKYIKSLKLHPPIVFSVLFLKDSRKIRHKDRQKILTAVKKSKHQKFIITHGTYTMPDTAQYVKDNLKNNKKTIIFTGYMIPLKGFELSDAPFNLGYSVAYAQTATAGVYICMNGKLFDPYKVDKNRVAARFEEIKRK